MLINAESFKVAALHEYEQAIKIIEEAEFTIAQLVGNEVTLIAYEQSKDLIV